MIDMAAAAQFLRGLSEAADAPASDADERATLRTESDSSSDERLDEEMTPEQGSDSDSVNPRPRTTKTQRKQSLSLWDVIVEDVSREVAMSSMDATRKVELGVGDTRWQPHTWKPKPQLQPVRPPLRWNKLAPHANPKLRQL